MKPEQAVKLARRPFISRNQLYLKLKGESSTRFRETCLELSIISFFINDLDDRRKNTHARFADNTVQGGTANMHEDRSKIQSGLDKLKKS